MTDRFTIWRTLRRPLAALAILFLPTAAAADMSGKASVIDGDTIEINGARIHLHGIDAPEMEQLCRARRSRSYKCGAVARKALSDLLTGRTVKCKGDARDENGQLIAKCFIEWLDIGAQMVLIGRALADRKQGNDYVRVENAARSMREGMWRGKFIPPWDWRRQQAGATKKTR